MATTLKSYVRLGDGSIISVADGLSSGDLVRTRFWDIQHDDLYCSLYRHSEWKFENYGCPQHRSEAAAREVLTRRDKGGYRLVRRDFIETPDGSSLYGQIGKTVVVDG